jgi:site-specific recombinase XerD
MVLCLANRRACDPAAGCWFSCDPIGEQGRPNLYAYVGGNPVGAIDRTMPLGARAALWLDKYLVESPLRLLGAASEALFATDWGEPVTPEHVAGAVCRAKRRAGIAKPGAAHLLRHACAPTCWRTAPACASSSPARHASLTTTERYTHVAITRLQQVHARTHPVARDHHCLHPCRRMRGAADATP